MFRDDRLLRSDPSLGERIRHGHQVLLDRWSSLVSVDALLDAHATVSQAQRSQRRFYPDGTWEAKVPAHRVGTPVYRMLASQKYREFRNASENPDLTEFEALLDFAYAQEIELVLLVSPLHSIPLNAIELAGQWPAYLSWQRRLVEAIDRHP
ncbi:MAG: hypothetical protein ACE1Y4_10165, partial [Lysobacterales bacterium]